MPSSFRYRLLQGASWGIAIDLRAESSPLPAGPLPPRTQKVAEGVWLEIDAGRPSTEEESAFLCLGLRLVAAEVAGRRAGPVLVRVVGLDYNPCDYQPEGLVAAVVGWAAREFGFPAPQMPVAFDRDRNRYVFSFGQEAASLGRAATAGS